MNAPRGLGRDGRRAWRALVETLEGGGLDPRLQAGRLERYARSVDHLAAIEAEWQAQGRPATATGSREQLVEHPLLGALRDQTRAVEVLYAAAMPPESAGWRRGHARSADRAAPPRRRTGKVIPFRMSDEVERAIADAEQDAG